MIISDPVRVKPNSTLMTLKDIFIYLILKVGLIQV